MGNLHRKKTGIVYLGAVSALAMAIVCIDGSKNGNINHPAMIDLVGRWQSIGTCLKDPRTYKGIYDFYGIGNHTYDIILSDGVEKTGRGLWSLRQGTSILEVKNDTGSVYVGVFRNDDFSTIALTTTNNEWGVVLQKERGGGETVAESQK